MRPTDRPTETDLRDLRARRLVVTRRAPMPLAYRLAYVMVNDGSGRGIVSEWYAPASSWGFDCLGRGNGLNLSTARAV